MSDKQYQYADALIKGIQKALTEDETGLFKDAHSDENITDFMHSILNVVPSHIYNTVLGDQRSMLEINHIANRLCFQYSTIDPNNTELIGPDTEEESESRTIENYIALNPDKDESVDHILEIMVELLIDPSGISKLNLPTDGSMTTTFDVLDQIAKHTVEELVSIFGPTYGPLYIDLHKYLNHKT